MRKIYLAEYLNYVDSNGNDIGHGKKVLNETFQLLQDQYEVIGIAASPYLSFGAKSLVHLKQIEQAKYSKIKLIYTKIQNIRRILSVSNSDLVWFTNIDWVLLVYMALFARKKPFIVTVYRNIIEDMCIPGTKGKRIKKYLVRQGLNKARFVIVTNPNLKISEHQINIPDYYYGEKYLRYLETQKEKRIVCLGAMRASKDLRGVIKHFSNTDIQVLIVGGFSDKDEYSYLSSQATNNIKIIDEKLPYEEYYHLLASSEFSIMPYDMKYYKEATSGILLESIFLNTIPITPFKILEENNVNGIGYDDISSLPTNYEELHRVGLTITNSMEFYEKKNIIKRLKQAFADIGY